MFSWKERHHIGKNRCKVSHG